MAKNDAGLREAFKSHMRGVQIFHQRNPRLFSSMAAANLFQRATPYATIYFSARILDGLAQRMEAKQLWVLIITALTITAFLSLMGAALERYKNLQYKITRKQMGKIYADKMLDMDYVDMDSQYIGDLYSQIRQTDQWFGWGCGRCWRLRNICWKQSARFWVVCGFLSACFCPMCRKRQGDSLY